MNGGKIKTRDMQSEIENIETLETLDLVTFMLATTDREIFIKCFNELYKRSYPYTPDFYTTETDFNFVGNRKEIRDVLSMYGEDTLLQLQRKALIFKLRMFEFNKLRSILYGDRVAVLVSTLNPSIRETPYFSEYGEPKYYVDEA